MNRIARPRRLQLELVAAELHRRRAEDGPGDGLDERLDPRHRVVVVGVRLVPLEHRELGVVLERDALVAKVLAELVHALEPADDEPLEVQLGRDAEVEVAVELVVMRHERPRERAAVARLEHRRLDLDEALAVEVGANRADDARAQHERLARLLVDEQVEVALAVAQLDVGEAVERVGKRLGVAREHLERLGQQRRLAAAGAAGMPGDADDVAEEDVDLARLRRLADHLDPARAVDDVEEDELAHVAPRHRPAGDPADRVGRLPGLERLALVPDRRDLVPVGEALRGYVRGGHRLEPGRPAEAGHLAPAQAGVRPP